MDIYSLLVILTAVRYFTDGLAANTCYSPQYLELGKTGTVNCVFEQGFFGIYWYNTTDYVNNKPVIHYNGVKIISDGYESGEFNVHPNGSLIINQVSPKHERVFTVAYIRTKQERPIITEIQLIIFVKPKLNFPDINACGNTTYFCFSKHKLPLHCTVRDVRPNVTLKWIMRQLNGDRDIQSEMEITSADVGFTTRAILTDILQDSPILVLLVCKASSVPILMEKNESFVLYQRKTVDLSQKAPQLTPVDRNSEILLSCTDGPIDFIVWQKINSVNESESEVLLYAVFVGEDHLNVSLASYATLNLNGSLKINSADKQHEGKYICIFGKGWTAYDLKIIEDYSTTEKGDVPVTRNNHVWFWFAIVIPIVIFFAIFFGILILIKHLKCRREYVEIAANDEEMTKILHRRPSDVTSNVADLKRLFMQQIKETYKDWYDAIQPIPYIKEKQYCVDKVFVEGGIEFLESEEGIGGRAVWATLESHEDVFNARQVHSPRRILEGEPGYGNSTVTLQFAYDWCNSNLTSVLKDVEILILLRLRQLGGVSSIYKAIKRFILPRDTRISEKDIENILRDSKSVVILLDGFDEYPDRDSTIITDVLAIVARQMFQDFEVITTTRSSILPKKYPPLTKRIRLTGFDAKARRHYIRKAVVGNDGERVKKIEEYLENNPTLSDLCQVPLLFVVFAHMTHENKQFRNLQSVTSFFRYMISCFHSHMKNKMKDENVRKYKLFEDDHDKLDKLAFEAFSGKEQKIVWDKDEMCRLLGQEFYEQYVRIGILVEEESFHIVDDPGTSITEHVQYKTEVRFYHKLFCEWYAANYLAKFLQQNPTVNLHDFVKNLDPFDVQYLYRFTCGIKSESGEKLIEYLQSIEGGDTFAILCILEQTGKMDNIKKAICKICDEGVIISDHDTMLLQRSSLQLLEVASKNGVPIEQVELYNCLQEVDLSAGAIKMKSGLVLTSRIPVKVLRIKLYNREMTEEEVTSVLKFSSMCSSLNKLSFRGSVPPRSFKDDSFLLNLRSRNVTVQWRLFKEHPVYILNTETCRWEKQGSQEEPTETEFEKMHAIFTDNLKNKDENYFKDQNKKKRETLRKDAEKRRQHNTE